MRFGPQMHLVAVEVQAEDQHQLLRQLSRLSHQRLFRFQLRKSVQLLDKLLFMEVI